MKIGYARVSTVDQDPELQMAALRAVGCERIIVETASGAKDDRPELARLLKDVLREGDVLVVWKLDRLARSLTKLIETSQDLQNRKIGFQSITEGMDTSSAGGLLIYHVLGAIAQFERSLIVERTRAGLNAARSKGRVGGRRPKMSAADVLSAKGMLSGGMSATDVAKKLGIGRATLYRVLGTRKNESLSSEA